MGQKCIINGLICENGVVNQSKKCKCGEATLNIGEFCSKAGVEIIDCFDNNSANCTISE